MLSSTPPFHSPAISPASSAPSRRSLLAGSASSRHKSFGPTFQERFCRHHGLAKADYTRAVLLRSLYPHARLLRPVLLWLNPDYFGPDLDFVRSVGLMRSRRDYAGEAADFHHADVTRDFLRGPLRLRVSAERLRRIVDATWGEE